MKILVVDDIELLRTLVSEQCQAMGHVTSVCGSADEALDSYWEQLCGGAPYDLVITDYQMPGKDGLALCDEIRRRNDLTPIILLTGINGVGLDAVRRKVSTMLRLRLMSKPFDGDELEEAINASQR